MTNPHDIEQWLQEGIAAAKAKEVHTARFRLLDVVEQDQSNETAWYWLYQVFDRVDDQRICLENLVLINPGNHWAKEELLKVLETSFQAQSATALAASKSGQKTPPARPVMLKLVIAFWVGISTIFLSSGIISIGAWLTIRYTNQTLIDFSESLELLIGIAFVTVGTTGYYIAAMLFLRSMIGFYGSVLLALGLLLVGPIISLISMPPNYASMICIGGISGMIVLLTLSSQPGFELIST